MPRVIPMCALCARRSCLPTEWGARAANLYNADYARRYRSTDDEIRHGALVERFGEWIGRVCDSFGRDIVVLDLGCGTGRYFWALRHVKELVGIDVSPAMLAEARQPVDAGAIRVGKMTLIEGDFLAQTFERDRFDLVYSIGVLGEHVPLDQQIAARVHQWLAPGGRFAFTAVHRESFSVPRTLKRRAGEWLMKAAPGGTRAQLRNRLLSGGLYVDEPYLRDELGRAGFATESIEQHESDVHLHCLSIARKARS
jgi:SAM-dependent methyltransferase